MGKRASNIFLLIVVWALLVCPHALPAAEPLQPLPAKPLVAVIPPDFPPTYFRDPQGRPAGLAVDVLNALARRTGLTISYRFANPWQEIEELVRQGEADLIPFRVISDKTTQCFLFTDPLDINYINYFVPAADKQRKGPQPGNRIGVIRGSIAHDYLKQRNELRLVPQDSLEHLLIDLLSGQTDLVLTATGNLWQKARELRLDDRIRVIEPAVLEARRGIALRQDDKALQVRLNQAIAAFHDSPEASQIYEKWLGKPQPFWTAQRTALVLGGLCALLSITFITWHSVTLHRSNRRLQAEQEFLQTLTDAIPDFIFYKDRNSVYLGCNKAFAEQIHHRAKHEIVGRTDAELLKRQDLAALYYRTDQEAMAQDRQVKFDVTVQLHNGAERQFEVIKTPFHDAEGQVAGVIGIARDITKRQQYQTQLEDASRRAEAASRAKSQFLANMSHEIRTPLNGVLGVAQLLAMTSLTPDQQEYLDMIQSSGENLLGILNDILDLTKIEADMLYLAPERFSPRELLEKLGALYRHLCRQKGLDLILEIASDLPEMVIGDPLRIKQILFNLLGNAVKFTPKGQVRLACRVLGSTAGQVTLQFKVCDTGIGISPEDQLRIFAPFEQADDSNTRQYGGTGLGLAICQRLCQLMNGALDVESQLGYGSCFMLTLQLQIAVLSHDSASTTVDRPTDQPLATGTILVAEDNQVNRYFIVKLLRQMGYDVLEAEDGSQALERLEQQHCDLVILDIQMPVMDGSQALLAIRQRDNARRSHTPVIALTAHAMTGDRERFLNQGFDDYLAKPLQLNELAAILSRLHTGTQTT